MVDPVFADFRAVGDDLLSEAKLKRLAEIYYAKAEKTRVALRPGGRDSDTPLNFRAPVPGANVPVPPGSTEFKLDEPSLAAIHEYFPTMNANIRALEKVQRAAE